MRLAVVDSTAELLPGDRSWRDLVRRTRDARPDLLLLNELPFGRWPAAEAEPSEAQRAESRRLHDEGIGRLGELGVPVVLGTRPALEEGKNVNQGFVWTRDAGFHPIHTKQFFPNEPGYWETRWFERGATHFTVAEAGRVRVGFLICTEIWFVEWARHYGRQGADLIVCPRATPPGSVDRWRVAMQMAAIVSGCYVATSNRVGRDARGETFAGYGWIVDPSGAVVAETSAAEPLVCAELDLALVRRAKGEYPCYVEGL